MISNRTRAARSFDFEITRMISAQIALHSVQLPLYIPPDIFRLNTVKDAAKVPAMDLWRLNALGDKKTSFLILKRSDAHPRHFYMGVPLSKRDLYFN